MHVLLKCRAMQAGKGSIKHYPAMTQAEILQLAATVKVACKDSKQFSQRKYIITGGYADNSLFIYSLDTALVL